MASVFDTSRLWGALVRKRGTHSGDLIYASGEQIIALNIDTDNSLILGPPSSCNASQLSHFLVWYMKRDVSEEDICTNASDRNAHHRYASHTRTRPIPNRFNHLSFPSLTKQSRKFCLTEHLVNSNLNIFYVLPNYISISIITKCSVKQIKNEIFSLIQFGW